MKQRVPLLYEGRKQGDRTVGNGIHESALAEG
jgi:hypothetical protein